MAGISLNPSKCCCGPGNTSCGTCVACTGADPQPDGGTYTGCYGGAGAQTRPTVGTVTDANGTYELSLGTVIVTAFIAIVDCNSTTCAGGTGPSPTKTGFSLYIDDGLGTCSAGTCPHGVGTLHYGYTFTCRNDGSVQLDLCATKQACSYDCKEYYFGAPAAGCRTVALSAIASPSCSTSALTATFTYGNLSGGQAPPGGTSVSVNINLANAGYFCCQAFQVKGCNGTVIQNAAVTVTGFATPTGTFTGSTVTGSTNSSGLTTLIWYGSCAANYTITGSPRFASTGTVSATFTAGSTTAVTLSPASGYTCTSLCACPWNNTLHVTYANAGAKTLVNSGSGWTASFSFGGHAYVATISAAGAYTLTQDGATCTGTSMTVTTCPTLSGNALAGTLNSGSCQTAVGSATFTE